MKLARALTGRGRGGKVKPTSHSGEAAWPSSQSAPCVQCGCPWGLPFWATTPRHSQRGFLGGRGAQSAVATSRFSCSPLCCYGLLGGCQQGGLARTFLLFLAPQQTTEPPLLFRPHTLTDCLGLQALVLPAGPEDATPNGLCPGNLLSAGRCAASWNRAGRGSPLPVPKALRRRAAPGRPGFPCPLREPRPCGFSSLLAP